MKMKKVSACFMAVLMLLLLVAPAAPAAGAAAPRRNAITKLGIKELPEDNTIQLKNGCYFNFDPVILATERGKGKSTGLVWWEVEAATNTAGVASSRWGYVYDTAIIGLNQKTFFKGFYRLSPIFYTLFTQTQLPNSLIYHERSITNGKNYSSYERERRRGQICHGHHSRISVGEAREANLPDRL